MTRRMISNLLLISGLAALSMLACRTEPEPTRTDPTELAPTEAEPEPEHTLIRFACQGFDRAVADGTPEARLLSTSAKHAVELGGAPVEAATQRWALLPPQGLLDLIDRYERDAQVDPAQCAGLRAHLERMNRRASTR